MNRQTNMQQTQQIVRDFQHQQQIMDMGSDMVDDAIDGIFETDETEVNEAMSEVLDSVGIDLHSQLSAAKTGSHNLERPNRTATSQQVDDDNELMQRLARLK